MKLYFTSTSPFVRKVLVAARELGLDKRIETELLRPSPLEPSAELSRTNPLSKIPALVLDDGSALYDSRVICEYFDTLVEDGATLVPPRTDRFRVLRLQALCDGILDAGILVFYERAQRPAELQWAPWLTGQSAKVNQGLDALESEVEQGSFDGPINLAQIALGVTLGWLELRNPVGDIRAARPKLTTWYEAFRARPSMRATEPRV